MRGDQSMKAVLIDERMVLRREPVRAARLVLASVDSAFGFTVTSSRITATPWTGSAHSGPWNMAS
jgi:hypothetical protein